MSERALIELLYDRAAHANPIACVDDLAAEVAARDVPGYPDTIWQLVLHMTFWMDYELRRMRGERPVYPEHASGSWPPNPAPAEAQWKDAVSRFSSLLLDWTCVVVS